MYQVLAASDLEKLLDRSDLTWTKDANKAKKGGVSKKQDAIEGVFKVCNLFIGDNLPNPRNANFDWGPFKWTQSW